MLCYLCWLRYWLALWASPKREELMTWEAFMLTEVEDGTG